MQKMNKGAFMSFLNKYLVASSLLLLPPSTLFHPLPFAKRSALAAFDIWLLCWLIFCLTSRWCLLLPPPRLAWNNLTETFKKDITFTSGVLKRRQREQQQRFWFRWNHPSNAGTKFSSGKTQREKPFLILIHFIIFLSLQLFFSAIHSTYPFHSHTTSLSLCPKVTPPTPLSFRFTTCFPLRLVIFPPCLLRLLIFLFIFVN